MLNWLKEKFYSTPIGPKVKIISRNDHGVSRKHISHNALKVLYRLKDAGYESYLVGGGIRDLLLNLSPKDFDIATNATPEQVKKIFRNSRIIGRRFRIVHVRFGREIIEVSTFRASHPAEIKESKTHSDKSLYSDNGMLLRDNVYGSIEDDAVRRDFTINALYYTLDKFAVHDYVGGMEDMENRLIRIIGDPHIRYKEDPVRMLRAARFAAKLDFKLSPETADPINVLAELLQSVPPARLFDEVLKLFMSGQGEKTYKIMRQYGLFQAMFPLTAVCLDEECLRNEDANLQTYTHKLLVSALNNTDKRIKQSKPVTPAFLYAALLWSSVQKRMQEIQANRMSPLPALQLAGQEIINEQIQYTAIPRRFTVPMKEIWELQLQLPRRHGKRAIKLLNHPRFRAAYDFLLLREQAGEQLGDLGPWWTKFQYADEQQQDDMIKAIPVPSQHHKRRKKRK